MTNRMYNRVIKQLNSDPKISNSDIPVILSELKREFQDEELATVAEFLEGYVKGYENALYIVKSKIMEM